MVRENVFEIIVYSSLSSFADSPRFPYISKSYRKIRHCMAFNECRKTTMKIVYRIINTDNLMFTVDSKA